MCEVVIIQTDAQSRLEIASVISRYLRGIGSETDKAGQRRSGSKTCTMARYQVQ